MKKILLTTLLLIFFSSICNSQSFIRDAIKIGDAADKKDADLVCQVLAPYVGYEKNAKVDLNQLINKFDLNKNTLIVDYLNRKFTLSGSSNTTGNSIQTETGTASTINAGSGVGVMLVDATAKLFLKRAKENLAIFLVEDFGNFINNDKTPGAEFIRFLFPKTTDFITKNILDSKVYQFSNALQLLREAFQEDFGNLISNLPVLIEKTKPLLGLDAQQEEILNYLSLSVKVYTDLTQNVKPDDIIESLTQAKFTSPVFKQTFQFLNIASKTLREATGNDNVWIKFNELNNFFSDIDNVQLFAGLVYEKFGSVKIFEDKPLNTFFTKVNLTIIKTYYVKISENVDEVQSILKGLKEKKNSSAGIEGKDYISFADRFSNTIISVLKMPNPSSTGPLVNDVTTKQITDVKEYVTKILLNLIDKNYLSALTNSFFLYSDKFNGFQIDSNASAGKMLKYGSFIALICQAKTQEDVDNAVESIVLPAGSFKMKRDVAFNFGLNGYLGFYGGNEWRDEPFNKGKGNFGLTAPIGLEGSFALPNEWSFSLFMPIIDISAPVSFRAIEDNSNVDLPDFTVKDLIAPGLFIMVGAKNIPFSFGGGIQYGPLFKKFDEPNSEDTKRLWRAGITLAFDIPLLNFYTRPKW